MSAEVSALKVDGAWVPAHKPRHARSELLPYSAQVELNRANDGQSLSIVLRLELSPVTSCYLSDEVETVIQVRLLDSPIDDEWLPVKHNFLRESFQLSAPQWPDI